MMPTAQDPTIQQLRAAGLRVTAQRCAVLDWLHEHPHATAEQIGDGVRGQLRSISRQTVYGVLATCVSAGLVRQIEPAGHPARFERRAGDNHHHLVCRWCGRIADADCVVGLRPCLTPDLDRGFEVDEAEVMFWGSCPSCRAHAQEQETAVGRPTAAGDHRQAHETAEV